MEINNENSTEKNMKYKLCIDDKEVERIIKTLQNSNFELDENLILQAIKSCCADGQIKSSLSCVEERIKILKLMSL